MFCFRILFFLYVNYVYLYKDCKLNKYNHKLTFYEMEIPRSRKLLLGIQNPLFSSGVYCLGKQEYDKEKYKIRGLFLKYGSFSASQYAQKSVFDKYENKWKS